MEIPFNRRHIAKNELKFIREILLDDNNKSHEKFLMSASGLIQNFSNANFVHLTNSCTGALEVSSHLCELSKGDEVIMPSFTFSSTANPVVLRGATPVFVDVSLHDINISMEKVEEAITRKTKAIFVVHYGGYMCDIKHASKIAKKNNLFLVEDAAQAVGSKREGISPGEISDFSAFSFHNTKNITCGEGGAITLNCERMSRNAEIIIEKGTDRTNFLRGEIDKYTWRKAGSSYVAADICVAQLNAQLEELQIINSKRRKIWQRYHIGMCDIETRGYILRPKYVDECEINGHIYFFLLPDEEVRQKYIEFMRAKGIQVQTHYRCLHSTKFANQNCRTQGVLSNTERVEKTLIRLPIYPSLTDSQSEKVIKHTRDFFGISASFNSSYFER